MTMDKYITVVVPSCPSGFKPYPELTIEATVQEFRIIATCLRALEKNHKPICPRLGMMIEDGYENKLHDCPGADEPMYRAISEALESTAHITTYCLRDCDWRALGMTTQSDIDELYTTLRSTWINHIERSIWEQIGH